ncbi:MAG: M3 family oligoendopeptidase [Planctomycetes bacterium]|nr:M3 family oligoendopeptidase [Planctomycetota bacterium]
MPPTAGATTRRYLSKKFAPTDWTAISAQFDHLEKVAALPDVDLPAWLVQYSELQAAIAEEGTRRHIDMTCATDDKEKEKAFLEFAENIVPKCQPRWQKLAKILLSHPKRDSLKAERWGLFMRSVENDIALFREENIPLSVEETRLEQTFQKVTGAMTVTWQGKETTMQRMGVYQEDRDRATRQAAWETTSKRRVQDRVELDGIYDKLVDLRHRMAKNAGFDNFRDFAFRAKERWDYTPEDCFKFHDAVERLIVPQVRRMQAERKKALGVAQLRPWDLSVDINDNPPLKPFEKSEQLFDGCREMFRRVDPSFATMIDTLRESGNLDLESRKGKAPGGYQTTLHEIRKPFIFMNAAGLNNDVFTFLHEGGHAFHSLLAKEEPILRYRHAPMEFCEVASMGMELLAFEHLDVFYKPEEVKRAKRKELEGIVNLFPWVATIDAFQHWVYTHPNHSRDERTAHWRSLRKRFGGIEDLTGYEDIADCAWQRQLHLFTSPFYYIEYGIAQLGALQVWANKKRNAASAVKQYQAALKLGGTKGLPELFRTAGIEFDLSERTIKPAIETVVEALAAV